MSRPSPAAAALAVSAALAATSAEAVQRTFVASYGNDGNTATFCGFANPCRTFTGAMTITDSGGEVVAMDAAGYGATTITKSITLTANPGYYAGIAASTGDAVTIATFGINVVLRGLTLNGVGAANGIVMTNGARLSIENCVISRFTSSGVAVNTPATVRIVDSLIRDNADGVNLQGGARVAISGSTMMGNSNMGVYAYGGTAAGPTTVAVSDSILTGNFGGVNVDAQPNAFARMSVTRSTLSNNAGGAFVTGYSASGTAVLTVSNSMVTGNRDFGLYQAGAYSTLKSLVNNTLDQNGADTSGVITTLSPK